MGPKPAAPKGGDTPSNRHHHCALLQHLANDRAFKRLFVVRPSPGNLPRARAGSMHQEHFGRSRRLMAQHYCLNNDGLVSFRPRR